MTTSNQTVLRMHASGIKTKLHEASKQVEELEAISQKMHAALMVIIHDPKINAWLRENDPMALKQVKSAI